MRPFDQPGNLVLVYPLSATVLILTLSPAACAASMPARARFSFNVRMRKMGRKMALAQVPICKHGDASNGTVTPSIAHGLG
jgi:hypothetical protein